MHDQLGAFEAADYKLWLRKILSALFYGCSSLALMWINKAVLTSYGFPSYEALGFGQILATVIVLAVAKICVPSLYPDFDFAIGRKVAPLSVIYVGNLFFGLGGTKLISLPMFIALRRFSILFTMIGEYFWLRVNPSVSIQLSVYAMMAGSVLAAFYDLSFNLRGYLFIFMNNVFTAGNAIFIKRILNSKELGEYGLMFYNAAFMLLPCFIYVYFTGELHRANYYPLWNDIGFVVLFLASCVMGFIINYSIVLCTLYNSALTTTVIGALKNILTIYVGMLVGGDYIFSWMNFAGLTLSVLASLFYSYVVFFESEAKRARAAPVIVTTA